MLEIYDGKSELIGETGRLAVLETAKEIYITREINGEYALSFEVPRGKKWQYICNENIVKCDDGQLFRIKTIEHTKVTAQAVYFDAARRHIQYIGDRIGVKPREIMEELFDETPVHVMTDDEVQDAGMEWLDELTDFFEASKITPISGMETMIQTLEEQRYHGELYIDNYNIALVKRIGRDTGARIDTAANAKEIKIQRDTSMLVTRLYPYGKDDLHIGSVNGGVQYLDSPDIKGIGVYEGYVEFSEIEEAEELLKSGLWQFAANNPNRVDAPKYTVTTDYVNALHSGSRGGYRPHIALGDGVTVVDRDFRTTRDMRVCGIEYYPYEPNKTKLTLGTPPMTVGKLFDGLVTGQAVMDKNMTDRGTIKTGWLECMQGNETIAINNDRKSQKIATYRTGALWVSPDGSCAVAIINGRVALSNQKRDGDWYWTTVSDAGKMIVNEVYTGVLYTEMVKLMGEGAKLEIENNMITFRDGETLRARWGVAGSESIPANGAKYVFELYAADGKTKTIYMDETGNAVFSGTVQASKLMGNEIYSSKIVGATKEAYDSLSNESSMDVPGVFAQLDPNGIKVMQDSGGVRLQKIGMTADSSGNAVFVMGAGNGYNKHSFNGVTYSDACFVMQKTPYTMDLSLLNGNNTTSIQLTNEGKIYLNSRDVLRELDELKRKVEQLENGASAT